MEGVCVCVCLRERGGMKQKQFTPTLQPPSSLTCNLLRLVCSLRPQSALMLQTAQLAARDVWVHADHTASKTAPCVNLEHTWTTYAAVLPGPVHHRLVMSRVPGERERRTSELKLLLVRKRSILPALGSESGPSLCAPRTPRSPPTGRVRVLFHRHIKLRPIFCVNAAVFTAVGAVSAQAGRKCGRAWNTWRKHFRTGKFLLPVQRVLQETTRAMSSWPRPHFGRTFFARG